MRVPATDVAHACYGMHVINGVDRLEVGGPLSISISTHQGVILRLLSGFHNPLPTELLGVDEVVVAVAVNVRRHLAVSKNLFQLLALSVFVVRRIV